MGYTDLTKFREEQEWFGITGNCKCSLSGQRVGDGCDLCNPALGLYHAYATINDMTAEIARLRKEIERLRNAAAYTIQRLDVHRVWSGMSWTQHHVADYSATKIRRKVEQALNTEQGGE